MWGSSGKGKSVWYSVAIQLGLFEIGGFCDQDLHSCC